MPLHQVGHRDLVALVEPVFFLVAQGAFEEIARAMKAQNRQAPLLGAAAAGREVVKQQLFAQHVVDRLGQGGALARTQAPVVAVKPRDDGVGGVIEFEAEPDQFGAGVQQGFRMHNPRLSHAPPN